MKKEMLEWMGWANITCYDGEFRGFATDGVFKGIILPDLNFLFEVADKLRVLTMYAEFRINDYFVSLFIPQLIEKRDEFNGKGNTLAEALFLALNQGIKELQDA